MRGLGYPESVYEYTEWKQSDPNNPNQDPNTSDGTLVIFNSNYQPSTLIKFQGLFPTSLSEIEFDASQTDVQYATASVTFKYCLLYTSPSPRD